MQQQPQFEGEEGDEGSQSGSQGPGSQQGMPMGMPMGGMPMGFGGMEMGQSMPMQTMMAPQMMAQPQMMQQEMPMTYMAAPGFRRPGYNERYVAWKNRQKAFNKYKKMTQRAISDTRHTSYYSAPVSYAAPTMTYAQPQMTMMAQPQQQTYMQQPVMSQQFGGFGGFPGGFDMGQMAPQYPTYGEGASFSSQQVEAAPQAAPQADEPEIRGTQV
jgi:hypothetical protein